MSKAISRRDFMKVTGVVGAAGLLAACNVANAQQCVPVSMTGRIFYWNKTTFDKAGISFPTTLDS